VFTQLGALGELGSQLASERFVSLSLVCYYFTFAVTCVCVWAHRGRPAISATRYTVSQKSSHL